MLLYVRPYKHAAGIPVFSTGANYLHNDALTYFGGVIDELRISPFARYTGNSFIPLTNAFEK